MEGEGYPKTLAIYSCSMAHNDEMIEQLCLATFKSPGTRLANYVLLLTYIYFCFTCDMMTCDLHVYDEHMTFLACQSVTCVWTNMHPLAVLGST